MAKAKRRGAKRAATESAATESTATESTATESTATDGKDDKGTKLEKYFLATGRADTEPVRHRDLVQYVREGVLR